jgi:hypothetical protein
MPDIPAHRGESAGRTRSGPDRPPHHPRRSSPGSAAPADAPGCVERPLLRAATRELVGEAAEPLMRSARNELAAAVVALAHRKQNAARHTRRPTLLPRQTPQRAIPLIAVMRRERRATGTNLPDQVRITTIDRGEKKSGRGSAPNWRSKKKARGVVGSLHPLTAISPRRVPRIRGRPIRLHDPRSRLGSRAPSSRRRSRRSVDGHQPPEDGSSRPGPVFGMTLSWLADFERWRSGPHASLMPATQ